MPNIFPFGYFDKDDRWEDTQPGKDPMDEIFSSPFEIRQAQLRQGTAIPRPSLLRAPVQIALCDYCGKPAKLVKGDEIYQHRKDLHDKKFWECIPCDAWVGCHPRSIRPLGRLANAVLRSAKSAAHREFDKLWRNGGMSRSRAYAWLAERMEIPPSKCHIGMFDEYQCAEVIVHCAQGVRKNAR